MTLHRLDKEGQKLRLEDFVVNSASTEMIHSEEMLDLAGSIRLTEPTVGLYRIVNDTAYAFHNVGVVRRRGGQVEFGWVGTLNAQTTVPVQFRTVRGDQPLSQAWEAAQQQVATPSDSLAQPQLLQLALDPGRLHEGDTRLVGWRDGEIAGVEIRPEASQRSFRTLLVANLQYGPLPPPESDRNTARGSHDGRHSMIELIDFGKDYGEFTAVECLNLKIEAGEMFGFIGPNGAGKSTTIRFLATLLKASRGEGLVNGCSVTADPMGVRQSVGYMPDAFGVYDGMKVWEFLDFFAVAYAISRSRRQAGDRGCARAAGSDAQTRRLRQRPVPRHEAAIVPGQDTGARSRPC